MSVYIILIVLSLIIPSAMLMLAAHYKRCGAYCNDLLAYRSKRSSIDIETQEFAHLYAAKLLSPAGVALLIIALIPAVFFLFARLRALIYYALIMIILQLAAAGGVFLFVEMELRETFDEYGMRKTKE